MKLITHNMLTSKCMKGVKHGYPLAIEARDVKIVDVEFKSDFVARVLPRMDWNTLWTAADSIGHAGDLPKSLIENYENNEEFLKKVHHILMEVEVIEGDLICPESGRRFPINSGIPNMILNEDEV
uniref:Multifunctional methyltransferase subunit TRM112-like protein n=1 Tax=Triatoma infestans TaxID=30076 RepID=A0A023F4E5_TRIIF